MKLNFQFPYDYAWGGIIMTASSWDFCHTKILCLILVESMGFIMVKFCCTIMINNKSFNVSGDGNFEFCQASILLKKCSLFQYFTSFCRPLEHLAAQTAQQITSQVWRKGWLPLSFAALINQSCFDKPKLCFPPKRMRSLLYFPANLPDLNSTAAMLRVLMLQWVLWIRTG